MIIGLNQFWNKLFILVVEQDQTMKNNKRDMKINVSRTQPSQLSMIGNNKIVRRNKQSDIIIPHQKGKAVQKYIDSMLSNYFAATEVTYKHKQDLNHSISVQVERRSKSKQSTDQLAPNLGSFKRFRRKSEKVLQSPYLFEKQNRVEYESCLDKHCRQQKSALKRSIQNISFKNNELLSENKRLQRQLAECKDKIRISQAKLTEKSIKLQELRNFVDTTESIQTKMQALIGQKSKEVIKLQNKICELLKQVQTLTPAKPIGYPQNQATEKIIYLFHQLKYRQIETYMLKKQKHDRTALLRQIKILASQNTILKQRLRYLIQSKASKPEVSILSSCSSLSLSVSDISFQS